jgi:hypothetical protein
MFIPIRQGRFSTMLRADSGATRALRASKIGFQSSYGLIEQALKPFVVSLSNHEMGPIRPSTGSLRQAQSERVGGRARLSSRSGLGCLHEMLDEVVQDALRIRGVAAARDQ